MVGGLWGILMIDFFFLLISEVYVIDVIKFIVIDGLVGFGKFSVFKVVVCIFGYGYFDMGFVYCVFVWYVFDCGVDIDDVEVVCVVVLDFLVWFGFDFDDCIVWVGEVEVIDVICDLCVFGVVSGVVCVFEVWV